MWKTGQLIRMLLLIILISLPALLMAQGGQPPGGPDGDDTLDNPIPFDGGVSLLVAAGIAYGLKKAHEKKKANKM